MRGSRAWVISGSAVAGAALLAIGAWVTRPEPEVMQGQVEVRRVNVGAKIAARIDSLLVREGDAVRAGQLLAVLRSPELDAKTHQADALVAAAAAQDAKARHGARVQEVAAAHANWERARAAETLAQTTWERIDRLFGEGVVAEQKRDEARTQWRAAQLTTTAARAQYDAALEGARIEDRALAAALLQQARGGRAEVEAFARETQVVAPIAGEITARNAETGEIVPAGLPIFTLSDLADAWVTFNVREDRLGGLAAGDTLTVLVPALQHRAVTVRVSYIAPVGDFATWRATGESGGFDLRTFEVRARPLSPVRALRPGMSVLLRVDQLKR